MGMREIQVAGKTLVVFEHDDVYDNVTGRALTGSWIWESALVLAEWMTTQGHLDFPFQGKTVIELGAGAGLPGLTAALLGADRVVLTDVDTLLPGLLKNVEANGLGDRVEVRRLVWGSDESLSELECGEFDLVLMSDVFLDTEETARLAKTLRRVCREGTRIWAASEVRPWTIECLNELTKEGFGLAELMKPEPADNENDSLDSFAVFCLTPDNNHVAIQDNHPEMDKRWGGLV
ncbi:hypothetical protein FNV43_RR08910 [Rhamnella rubrinervis]|uniref:Methyltransferase domain-containing protein n=1 Tax=Rhamnella rubrinervis TaxID=2594499 RepID=A0A8K0H957_9ROSA|nr:hypothetical protein FNV43_RR08910 [Rhamnella rubrinervis]